MAKDPAFLFYPNDYLGGTMGMTFEEKGAYIELLMLQFNRGHMDAHMIGQVVGQLWVKIQVKFKQDDKGLFFNERLELEIERRKRFIESRLNNISGKNQYSKNEGHKGGHMTPHMENENENENNDKGVPEKISIPPQIEWVKAYCSERGNRVDADMWYSFYQSKGWMVGKNKMKDWRAAIRTWEKNGKDSSDERFVPKVKLYKHE